MRLAAGWMSPERRDSKASPGRGASSSGDIQPSVPPRDSVCATVAPPTRMRLWPMSQILSTPPLNRMFVGLRSRCTIWCACRYSIPSNSCSAARCRSSGVASCATRTDRSHGTSAPLARRAKSQSSM
jgi:hypothetical protein